jgi:hypothetical protein
MPYTQEQMEAILGIDLLTYFQRYEPECIKNIGEIASEDIARKLLENPQVIYRESTEVNNDIIAERIDMFKKNRTLFTYFSYTSERCTSTNESLKNTTKIKNSF